MFIMAEPITLSGAMPSAAVMLGTSVSSEIIQEVNQSLGSTYIGDRYDEYDNDFYRNIVAPARAAVERVRYVAASLELVDDFIDYSDIDQMSVIPRCMQLPLLLLDPVRKLAEQGRIDTFGYDPARFPDENPYQRLVDNGVVRCLEDQERDGDNINFELTYEWRSTDPDLDIREIDCIDRMYQLVTEDLLNGGEMSPTDRTSPIA